MTPTAASGPCNTPPSILEKTEENSGFTLIELSIVLVIIALLIGGVIIGKDLIEVAKIRSQASQIEQFNTAVNAFRDKFNCLPGDCRNALQYGFVTRANSAGRGDGNGYLTGNPTTTYYLLFGIEHVLFWRDLSDAGLIPYTLLGTDTTYTASATVLPTSYFPASKMSSSTFVYAWSGGPTIISSRNDGFNYFGITNQSAFDAAGLTRSPSFTVAQAYALDSKIDDGLPQQGNVLATVAGINTVSGQKMVWANGVTNTNGAYDSVTFGAVTSATSPAVTTSASSTTCYDNGGVANARELYSMSTSSGSGLNCYVSVRMQ